ncbi:hypothetical protein EOL70_13480 [Leucothrix sargassi]|nr:hypothetical protein EOL70_13480 [Leucothrix sargassi]
MSTEYFRPTFIRTAAATEKLLTKETNGLSLNLQYIVISDSKFEPNAAMTTIPNALDPIAIGNVTVDLAKKQKTLAFSIPMGVGDLRVNAVGILDSDGDLAYVWSSTDPLEHLGYKELGSRYVQGVVLKVLDAPFDSVQIVDDGSLANIDLSFADIDLRHAASLATTMVAIGELSAHSLELTDKTATLKTELTQQKQQQQQDLNTAVDEVSLSHISGLAVTMLSVGEMSVQSRGLNDRVIQQAQRLSSVETWQAGVTSLLNSQINFNATVHAGIGTLAINQQ